MSAMLTAQVVVQGCKELGITALHTKSWAQEETGLRLLDYVQSASEPLLSWV